MKDETKVVGVFKLKLELLNQYSLEEEEKIQGVCKKNGVKITSPQIKH